MGVGLSSSGCRGLISVKSGGTSHKGFYVAILFWEVLQGGIHMLLGFE